MNYEEFDLDDVIKDLFRILAPHSESKKNFFKAYYYPNFPKLIISDKNRIY